MIKLTKPQKNFLESLLRRKSFIHSVSEKGEVPNYYLFYSKGSINSRQSMLNGISFEKLVGEGLFNKIPMEERAGKERFHFKYDTSEIKKYLKNVRTD